MSISRKQEAFYWRLWSELRKARPGVDRHEEHARAGCPGSHSQFSNEDFDRWKGHCLAAAQPGNYEAQVAQQQMPARRRRHAIGRALVALGAQEGYAEGILQRMNRNGAQGGPMLTLETASEEALGAVLVALRKEVRRRARVAKAEGAKATVGGADVPF